MPCMVILVMGWQLVAGYMLSMLLLGLRVEWDACLMVRCQGCNLDIRKCKWLRERLHRRVYRAGEMAWIPPVY